MSDTKTSNSSKFTHLELELHVLQQLIDSEQAFDKYNHKLDKGLFYYPNNQKIFHAIESVKTKNPYEAFDLILVRDELKHTGELDNIGGDEYLNKLMGLFSLARLDSLDVSINSLREWTTKRIINDAIINASNQLNNGANSDEVANRLIETISLAQQTNSEVIPHKPIEVIMGMAHEAKNISMGEQRPFLDLGFLELSFKLALNPKEMFVLAGQTSMGKTALALNIVTAIAKKNLNKTALIFSLEMPNEQITRRLVCSAFNVNANIFTGNKVANEADFTGISKAGDLENNFIHSITIFDKRGMTIQDIRTQCQRVKRDEKKELSVIMIDYLQIMQGLDGDKYDTRVSKIGKVTREIRELAQIHNCPVILLSQLNREAENRERPSNSDLRDSGAIEQDADKVAFIYRDDMKNPDTKEKGLARLHITKNRSGYITQEKPIMLRFEGEYNRFSDYISKANAPDLAPPSYGSDVPFDVRDKKPIVDSNKIRSKINNIR